jgi:hypothetical protein
MNYVNAQTIPRAVRSRFGAHPEYVKKVVLTISPMFAVEKTKVANLVGMIWYQTRRQTQIGPKYHFALKLQRDPPPPVRQVHVKTVYFIVLQT